MMVSRRAIAAVVLAGAPVFPALAQQPDASDAHKAAAVVQAYYQAIDAGQYHKAYGQWADDGAASNQSFADFKAGFAKTKSVEVFTGAPTDMDAGAGSIFITVPVRIEATLTDGTEQHFAGDYKLVRVNDVPGASKAQLSWHLQSADIHSEK